MAGDLITCPVCDGWSPAETGMMCDLCGGEGVVWKDEPDDDADDDYPEMHVVNVGDELHQVLGEALAKAKT